MTGPTFSPDGQWMWDGNAWIPAPPQANVLPQASLNQNQISTVANNAGVPFNQLSNTAPYFDQNRDGILQNTELQQAAAAIAQQPTMPVPMQSPQPPVMQQPMMQQPMMQQPMMQQPMMQQPMMRQPVAQHNPPNLPMGTVILNHKKGNTKIIFAITALLMIVIASTVFYVWKHNIAPEYSSPYTWDGNIDSGMLGSRWYDSESSYEVYYAGEDIGLSTEILDLVAEMKITSYHHQFNWPYSTSTTESDGSDWSTLQITYLNQINGDVWFSLTTGVTIDGDYTEYDDGECHAFVGNNVFYKDGNEPTDNNWRSVVGDTNWPSFCDSVIDY